MTGPDTIIPTPSKRTPQCGRCGFAVENEGELCGVCQDKENAKPPVPMFQIRAPGQPEAPGAIPRDGRPERDPDAEEEDEEEG